MSMAIAWVFRRAQNTGICTTRGRQPMNGLIFSRWYSAIISCCCLAASSLKRVLSFSSSGWTFFILVMDS